MLRLDNTSKNGLKALESKEPKYKSSPTENKTSLPLFSLKLKVRYQTHIFSMATTTNNHPSKDGMPGLEHMSLFFILAPKALKNSMEEEVLMTAIQPMDQL